MQLLDLNQSHVIPCQALLSSTLSGGRPLVLAGLQEAQITFKGTDFPNAVLLRSRKH